MNDIPTVALLFEIKNRMERHLYDNELDQMLTDMDDVDTMGMYFAIEEYMLSYKEIIEERNSGIC